MQGRRPLLGLLSALAATAAAAAPAENGRLHHIHMNVSDIPAASTFYRTYFGAMPVSYAGRAPALIADRTFLFFNKVAAPIPSSNQTGLIHIGWGGVDPAAEYAWLKGQGIEFFTPLTSVGAWSYMYLLAPDRQVVEIWTAQKSHRLNHVHLLAGDPKAVAEWFAKVTNSASPAVKDGGALGNWNVSFGDVTLHVLPDVKALRPRDREGPIAETDGHGIDHVAFSYRDLDAAYRRVKAQGVAIVRPPATDPVYGLRSFFVRAPNGVLVEFVKANPLPDAAWM